MQDVLKPLTPHPACYLLQHADPPNIVKWILSKMYSANAASFPLLPITSLPQKIILILAQLFPLPENKTHLRQHFESIVAAMASLGLTESALTELPVGISLPIRVALYNCRLLPPSAWSIDAYRLIGRDDLVAQSSSIIPGSALLSQLHPLDPAKFDLKGDQEFDEAKDAPKINFSIMDNPVCAFRFGMDQRLTEVERLLTSSNPTKLALPDVCKIEFRIII
jgi:hypothetical protein